MMATSTDKHVLAGKRIVISGAGLAGLIFARALEQNWPETQTRPQVIIYERSPEIQPKARAGYNIGIRMESGLKALHQVGLLPEVLENNTCQAYDKAYQSATIWDGNWTQLMQASYAYKPFKGMPKDTPAYIRINRETLRSILLNDSTAEIHYESMIKTARLLDDGTTELSLADGTTATCDLLIAADGASSTLRRSLLPEQKLSFAGVVCYIGQSHFPQGKPAPFDQRWGFNLNGSGVPFLSFPVDATHGVWSASYRAKEPVKRVSTEEAEERFDEILDEVHTLTHAIQEPCKQFVDATEHNTLAIFNAMHKYPVDHAKDIPKMNIIFLGDANHPMSPFSGNGANMALLDGVSAAEKLIEHERSVRAAVAAFDAESMPRSKKAIDNSWWTIRLLHAQGLTYWVIRAVFALKSLVDSLKGEHKTKSN